MGLIDFVKSAGESLLETVGNVGEKISETVGFGGSKSQAGETLQKTVQDLGIPVDGLKVEVNGDVATISGTAATQADREKAILAVGNTKGIAQVDDRITAAKPEPEATYYTVERGDTLSKIAKEQYGNASKYPVIFEANRPMLKDPDKIYPGQKLRIPPL
jgi:nucleoid-associated protein YgaU